MISSTPGAAAKRKDLWRDFNFGYIPFLFGCVELDMGAQHQSFSVVNCVYTCILFCIVHMCILNDSMGFHM